MNADLIKRFFRAIQADSEKDLHQLCQKIIEEEKGKGHTALAQQLETILNQPKSKTVQPAVFSRREKELGQLPTSSYNDPLVSTILHDALRHHMVLDAKIEAHFHRIEQEYVARERLALYGLQPRKKILLYGPPGCGKTLGAERLAWNTGLPLIKVRFDAMISSFFGESAANLRRIFESVADAPYLLLLDECDFIAKSRNTTNDVGELSRIVNTLLQLLEDYEAPGLLVATTNLDKTLDRAIFRRFDTVFEIPLPGLPQIKKLLEMSLSTILTDKHMRWNDLAKKLLGTSAANVVQTAQHAAKKAILESREIIRQEELEASIAEKIQENLEIQATVQI